MFGRLLCCYAIYTFWGLLPRKGLLPRNGILPGAKFTLRPSLAFYSVPEMTYNVFSGTLNPTHFTSLHLRSILAALLHGNRAVASATLCGMVQGKKLRNFRSSSLSTEGATYISSAAITLGIGPHSSCLIIH